MKALVAAVSFLVLASPAVAQMEGRPGGTLDHGSSNQPGDSARTGNFNEQGERLICRTISDSSTSRMASRRVCRTAEQWRAISRASN